MKSHLKIKYISMSYEMTYIHKQEIKWKERARRAREKQKFDRASYADRNFWSQRGHRLELKIEARITHLAYGFMRGVPYKAMEQISYSKGMGGSEPQWDKISSMVERFSKDEDSPQDYMQRFSEWLSEAVAWYDGNPDRIAEFAAKRPERIAALKAVKKPFIPAKAI